MKQPNLQPLTYLAQVRQLHFKSAWLSIQSVSIMPPFLLIKPNKKLGISHKEIATIGIAHVADLDAPSKSMGVWLRVAGHWLHNIHFTLSLSLAGERK